MAIRSSIVKETKGYTVKLYKDGSLYYSSRVSTKIQAKARIRKIKKEM